MFFFAIFGTLNKNTIDMETNIENKEATHWRKVMSTPFLNGEEIPEAGQVVTIDSYKKEKLFSPKSKKEEELITLKFKEIAKPMILTNRKAKQISKVIGSEYMADWIGKTITIFPIKEKHFGDYFKVIHAKAGVIELPVFDKKHERWAGAVEALKAGTSTIEAIEKHYTITDAVRKELQTYLPKNK
jgi:hypothetical protein